MAFPEGLRNIGRRLLHTSLHKEVAVKKPLDPVMDAAYERIGRTLLLSCFTQPALLSCLGAFANSQPGFQAAGESLIRMQSEFGMKSDFVQTATSIAGQAYQAAMLSTQALREQALSYIPSNKRVIVEGAVLFEAQKILTERLKTQRLSPNHRRGAQEMLKRIESHLKTDLGPTTEQ